MQAFTLLIVNIASRMESGGYALRIHVSETTAEILKKLGGYHLECRGERDVKVCECYDAWMII